MQHPLAIDPADEELAGLRADVDLDVRPDHRARPDRIGRQANVARPPALRHDGIDRAKPAAGRVAAGLIPLRDRYLHGFLPDAAWSGRLTLSIQRGQSTPSPGRASRRSQGTSSRGGVAGTGERRAQPARPLYLSVVFAASLET